MMVSGNWHYRGAARLGAAVAVLALAGCSSLNPVNWYHDVVGGKPLPAPDTVGGPAPGSDSEEPYPTLASVPTPPTTGLTQSQRATLADGLIADREHARYADQEADAATVPLPPPVPDSFAPSPAASTPDLTSEPDAEPILPPPHHVHKVRAKRPPVARRPAPPSAEDQALAASGLSSGGVFDSAGDVSAPPTTTPRESPEPEAVSPPPPAPNLPPVPAASAKPPAAAATSVATAATSVPAAPSLSAVPAEPASAAVKPAISATRVTSIQFAAGSSALPAGAAAALAPVAGIVKASGGKIHVISAAPGGADAASTLAVYHQALARSKAVKQALVASGIPASGIVAEVSTGNTQPVDTTEVVVQH